MTSRKFLALFAFLFLLILGASCQKTYTVSPLSPGSSGSVPIPTATSTPVPFNICATLTPVPVTPSGIYWNTAEIVLGVVNYASSTSPIFAVELDLLINGNAETTTGVTVLAGGSPYASVPYSSTTSINGVNYAYYFYYQPVGPPDYGANWTLVTATSIGTASATLQMPGPVTPALDGSAVSWTNSGIWSLVQVLNSSGVTTFTTPACGTVGSPVNIPSSAYPASGSYTLEAVSGNLTTSITGGQGLLLVGDVVTENLTK